MTLSPEQRKFRKGKLTGSLWSSAIGMNPWCSPVEAFDIITGRYRKESNKAMAFGTRIEPVIRQWFREDTDLEIVDPERLFHWTDLQVVDGTIQHPRWEWFCDTPDGAEINSKGEFVAAVEIKAPSHRTWHHWGPDEQDIPLYYWPQVHCHMEILQVDSCWVPALIDGEVRQYKVKRNQEFWDEMFKIGKAFIECYVQKDTPPLNLIDGSNSSRDWLNRHYPLNRIEDMVQADDFVLEKYIQIKKRIDESNKEMNELKNHIKSMIGENTGLASPSAVATWKTDKRGVRTLRVKERKP